MQKITEDGLNNNKQPDYDEKEGIIESHNSNLNTKTDSSVLVESINVQQNNVLSQISTYIKDNAVVQPSIASSLIEGATPKSPSLLKDIIVHVALTSILEIIENKELLKYYFTNVIPILPPQSSKSVRAENGDNN